MTCLDVLEDAEWVTDCTCGCHGGLASHSGVACRCGGYKALGDRLGMSPEAVRQALRRARLRRSA